MSDTITLEGASRSTGANRKKYMPVTFKGRAAVGYVYLTGVGVDEDTVPINGRIYELLTALPLVAGDVPVVIGATTAPQEVMPLLVAAINGDALRTVDAIEWVGNAAASAGCTLVARTEDNLNHTLVDDLTNGAISAATLQGGAVPAPHGIGGGTYGVTAADVTALALAAGNEVVIGAITTVNQPTITSLLCQTAAGAVKSLATVIFTLRQVNGNFWALTVDDGAAVLANGDIIAFTLGY